MIAERRGGEKKAREKKEDARVRTEVNTTNAVGTHCATRGLEADSEDEEKSSKSRLRAPVQMTLGKKRALVPPVRPEAGRRGGLKRPEWVVEVPRVPNREIRVRDGRVPIVQNEF